MTIHMINGGCLSITWSYSWGYLGDSCATFADDMHSDFFNIFSVPEGYRSYTWGIHERRVR